MCSKLHACAVDTPAVKWAGAGNDYQKDRQFRKLNAQKDIIEIKVLRGGEEQLIANTDLVVVSTRLRYVEPSFGVNMLLQFSGRKEPGFAGG